MTAKWTSCKKFLSTNLQPQCSMMHSYTHIHTHDVMTPRTASHPLAHNLSGFKNQSFVFLSLFAYISAFSEAFWCCDRFCLMVNKVSQATLWDGSGVCCQIMQPLVSSLSRLTVARACREGAGPYGANNKCVGLYTPLFISLSLTRAHTPTYTHTNTHTVSSASILVNYSPVSSGIIQTASANVNEFLFAYLFFPLLKCHWLLRCTMMNVSADALWYVISH